MCIRNLFRRRIRTSLSVLGIALGITLIIAVGATTNNYVTFIKEMNTFYPGSVVVVARGSIFVQAISVGGFLHESTVEEVRGVEGAQKAVPMIFILGSSQHEGVFQLVPANITVGVPFGEWAVLTGSVPLKPGGRWPSLSSSEREVVLGSNIPSKYNLLAGSEIVINNKKLKVVGILDVPSASSFLRDIIIMPLNTVQEVYAYQQLISLVVVEPDEGISEKVLSDRIEAEIIGVKTLTVEERNEVVGPIFRDIELWSLGIGSAIYCINIVLVIVVSLMNVSERRRELATLDAIGVPKISIVRMVVTETGLMGFFGSVVGIPLGIIAALLIIFFYTQGPMSIIIPDVFIIVPPIMILKILVSTFALSCIAGLIPAISITRKNIVELMRSE